MHPATKDIVKKRLLQCSVGSWHRNASYLIRSGWFTNQRQLNLLRKAACKQVAGLIYSVPQIRLVSEAMSPAWLAVSIRMLFWNLLLRGLIPGSSETGSIDQPVGISFMFRMTKSSGRTMRVFPVIVVAGTILVCRTHSCSFTSSPQQFTVPAVHSENSGLCKAVCIHIFIVSWRSVCVCVWI